MHRRQSFHLLASLLLLSLLMLPAPRAFAAWSSTGNLVADSSVTEEPQSVAPDGSGGMFVGFSLVGGQPLRLQRLDGFGAQLWGDQGVSVNPGGLANSGGLVRADSAGGCWVAWSDARTTGTGRGIYVQRFDAAGNALLTAGGLRILNRSTEGLAAATSSAGELLVAHMTTGDTLRLQRVATTGALEFAGEGIFVADSTSGFTSNVQVFADGEGAVLAYNRFMPASGGGFNTQMLWANRYNSAGAAQWGAAGVAVMSSGSAAVLLPNSVWSGASLYLSWQHAPTAFNFAEQYPIRAQRVSGGGAPQWTANGVTVFTPVTGTFFQHLNDEQKIAYDGVNNSVIIAWLDGRNYWQPAPNTFLHGDDIYAQRLSITGGVPQWTANGMPIDSTAGGLDDLQGFGDGVGGMYLAYTDFAFGDGDEDVELRRIDNNGTTLWSRFLNPINGTGRQRDPVVASDGEGGALVAWEDDRTASTGPDVYATRRTAASGNVFAPTLTVTQPNGGESFASFEAIPVRWTSNYTGGLVRIELRRDGAPPTNLTVFGTPNDGGFDWSVSGISAGQYKMIISDFATGAPKDSSDAFFSLCPALVSTVNLTLGSGAADAVTGDFDEDGILDVAAVNAAGVAISRGGGSGGVWNQTFGAAVTVALPGGRGIAAGDWNGDGITDLVATHDGGVSWLAGLGAGGVGTGSFAAPVALQNDGASDYQGIVLTDLDADGVLDAVAARRGTDRIAVMLQRSTGDGAGDGTLAQTRLLTVQDRPERVVVADVNGDAMPDILNTNRGSGSVSVHVALGHVPGFPTGAHVFARHVTVGDSVRTLAVGDFNEDNALDLVVGRTLLQYATTMLLGLKTGSVPNGDYAAPVDYAVGGEAAAVVDYDGDGRSDVITASALLLRALRGDGTGATGDGTFTIMSTVTGVSPPTSLEVDDFDRDGTADLLVVSSSSNQSRVFLGGCDPTVAVALAVTEPDPGDVTVADQAASLFWTKSVGNGLVHLDLSRDGGTNWEPLARHRVGTSVTLPLPGPVTTAARLRVTDALNPGRSATMPANFTICRVLVAGQTMAHGDEADDVTLYDMDDDGVLDLVIDGTTWRHGNGDATFGSPQSLGLVGNGEAIVTDLDLDGAPDVIATNRFAQTTIALGQRVGGAWNGLMTVTQTIPGRPWQHALGDFDEDGIPDLVTSGNVTATPTDYAMLSVYRGGGAVGRGDGTFARTDTMLTGRFAGDVVVQDLNADGILDLAVSDRFASAVHGVKVFLGGGSAGNGNGTFGAPVNLLPGVGVSALVAADLDSDGKVDLLAAPGPGDALRFLKGAGTGAFTETTQIPCNGAVDAMELVDLDEDGRIDIVLAEYVNDSLRVILRRGPDAVTAGSFVTHQRFFAGASAAPSDVTSGDLDGDGRPELVLASRFGEHVKVFEHSCAVALEGDFDVSTPNGGEVFGEGQERVLSISVGSSGLALMDLDVSFDGGDTWRTIARNQQSKNFAWTVTGPPTAQALYRVRHPGSVQRGDVSNATFRIEPATTDTDGGPRLPSVAAFSAPRPNPSRGAMLFSLALPAPGHVHIDLFDLGGRRVRTLVDGSLEAGEHQLMWDGRDDAGQLTQEGVYFARARGAGLSQQRSVVRLR